MLGAVKVSDRARHAQQALADLRKSIADLGVVILPREAAVDFIPSPPRVQA